MEELKAFYSRIKKDFPSEILVKPKFESLWKNDIYTLTISVILPPYKITRMLSLQEISIIMTDDVTWEKFLSSLVDSVVDATFESIKVELGQFLSSFDVYKKFAINSVIDHGDLNGRCHPKALDDLSCGVFIKRMTDQCRTIALLAKVSNVKEFAAMETSIAILLRSCVLDCLLIFAWVNDPNLIAPLTADSFLHLPGGTDQKIKEIFHQRAIYYNIYEPDNLGKEVREKIKEEVGMDNIYALLKLNPYIRSYEKVYSKYSKYDHYSLIPYEFPETIFQMLDLILSSLHIMKHAFCMLIALQFDGQNSDILQIEDIFNIKVIEEQPGIYNFTSKH